MRFVERAAEVNAVDELLFSTLTGPGCEGVPPLRAVYGYLQAHIIRGEE
jgi:hypothetical protein